MGDAARASLADYVRYLPRVRALGLGEDELRSIPVHDRPPSDDVFLSLGELPPGAPPLEPARFRFVGTRQIYVYRSDLPASLWQRLVVGLAPRRSSGAGGTGMFGNAEEQVVDEENPVQSWRVLDAGEPYRPWEM